SLLLRQFPVRGQDVLEGLSQPLAVAVLHGAGQQPAGRRHEHQLGAAEPAVALVLVGLRGVEAFPGGLIDLVLAVDEPAGGEADELLVEGLDGVVGVQGRTTCQVVRRGTSADAERLVVAGSSGVEDDDGLVLGGGLLAGGDDVREPLDLEMPPFVVVGSDEGVELVEGLWGEVELCGFALRRRGRGGRRRTRQRRESEGDQGKGKQSSEHGVPLGFAGLASWRGPPTDQGMKPHRFFLASSARAAYNHPRHFSSTRPNSFSAPGGMTMALAPSTRLGPYEILAKLGAGGMGEVYRARDVRLDRDVAIKILPESSAHEPQALARFQR